MSSVVDIANRALTKIGASRIVSLSDDSTEAIVVNSMFMIVRDDELRAHNWNFAMARAQLSADATPPSFGYDQRFLLPTDCLRVLMVGDILPGGDLSDYRNADDSALWSIEGGYILISRDGPLKLRYLRRITDTAKWDSSFVEAFACRLAAESCEAITQSSEKRQMAWNEYDRAIRKAIRARAIELPPKAIADDTWVLSRTRNG